MNYSRTILQDAFQSAYLQGRAKIPTGGDSPRIPLRRNRSGENPEPTVKVWMREDAEYDYQACGRNWRMRMDLLPFRFLSQSI